jgi:hypothetical protein
MAEALALDAVSSEQRELAERHLDGCAPCRELVSRLSETTDRALAANPPVTPRPGFEERVIQRLKAERSSPPPERRG